MSDGTAPGGPFVSIIMVGEKKAIGKGDRRVWEADCRPPGEDPGLHEGTIPISRLLPPAQGLYRPRAFARDACGIGFVASIEGRKSHDIVLKGVQILVNLAHRGACGCDRGKPVTARAF